MKILGFDDFSKLPAGTIFSYFEPQNCSGLFRKGQTILRDGKPQDFYEASLVPACWNGEPPTIDDIESRWGMYEYDQLFAVFEPVDIDALRKLVGII